MHRKGEHEQKKDMFRWIIKPVHFRAGGFITSIRYIINITLTHARVVLCLLNYISVNFEKSKEIDGIIQALI